MCNTWRMLGVGAHSSSVDICAVVSETLHRWPVVCHSYCAALLHRVAVDAITLAGGSKPKTGNC